ncbi:MAG: hypothetical protein AAGF88_03510 [Pseudomonadota bacterium]
MSKIVIFPLLLLLAALAAALFGALHNQLSFTVGPDYFYVIKFPQFGIENMPDRLAAAWVGVQASWWMGLFVGAPAFLFGLMTIARSNTYFAAGLGAIFLVVILTLGFAIMGLLAGMLFADHPLMDRFAVPDTGNRIEILRAALMHNASYLGGAVGAVAAFFPMVFAARTERRLNAA